MKAKEANFLQFLRSSPQFSIPIYQRTYSWTERECWQLWSDIIRTGKSDTITAHFVGSIVYIEKSVYQITSPSSLLVIDGQQRLTTVTLLLEALARVLEKHPDQNYEPLDGFSAIKIRSYLLKNPLENGEKRYKLILSQTDKDSLIALVDKAEQPPELSIRINENFGFFENWIQDQDRNLINLCKGLAKLMVVDIALTRGQDNPQLIFESMNSTGRELSQADLIRNYILMGLEQERQTQLYRQFWRPMEIEFGQEAYSWAFDRFMRHYLVVKTGEIPNINEIYEKFKVYAQSSPVVTADVEALVADLRQFARYFCAMALGRETDPDLKLAFQDLRELRVDVAYPLLLELYHDYSTQTLAKSDFLDAVRIIESYVFRRAICSLPTNSLNKTFATLSKALKKDRYLESIKAHFLLMPSYRGFPSSDEFCRQLQTRDLYNFPRKLYWLRCLENFNRKEPVPVDEYTIEHIMPQNPRLSGEWKQALGPEWKRIQETWLHTLGNLTLTGYNSEYSDRPFPEKRDISGGFNESPLKLNKGLGQLDNWNEDTIKDRAERLSKIAVKVWELPQLSDDVLAAYKPAPEPGAYGIVDHPQLAEGKMKELFDALRKEVLAIDPCVTEEFLKLYIAYKAETNFVDVIPQAKRLLLSLNLKFSELIDPRGISKDMTGIGRWGNGDVQVPLTSVEDIPYAIGLVRQAFEVQMGADVEA
jgi:uncharacterized protein with ParB-like and HNH nuclease domain/predicted transport protein